MNGYIMKNCFVNVFNKAHALIILQKQFTVSFIKQNTSHFLPYSLHRDYKLYDFKELVLKVIYMFYSYLCNFYPFGCSSTYAKNRHTFDKYNFE